MRFPPLLPRRTARGQRLPALVPAPGRQRVRLRGRARTRRLRQDERADRHEDWSEFQRMTELALVPAACYPVYPVVAARGPLRAGRHRRRRRRRVGLPPRAVRGPGATADVPPARDRADRRAGGGPRLARHLVASAGWRCCAASASRPSATARPTRSSVAAGECSPPTSATRSSSSSCSCRSPATSRPRSPRSTITRSTSPRSTASRSPTASTAHTACLGFGQERIVLALLRTHGLDPAAWPAEVRGELWGSMTATRTGTYRSLFDLDARQLPAPCRSTAPDRTYARDQLLHRHHRRAAARARRRAARRARAASCARTSRATSGRSSSRRPRTSRRCSASTSTRCSRTGRCRCRSPSRSTTAARSSSSSTPGSCPDTAATSYRSEHVKTSVAAEAIDLERGWLRYFHGAGLYELDGEDYAGDLPPRRRARRRRSCRPTPSSSASTPGRDSPGAELRAAARALAAPAPRAPAAKRSVRAFRRRSWRASCPSLLEAGPEAYHAYAFATVRMVGAAFELAAAQAEWLLGARGRGAPATAMRTIVDGCKVLGFRLARRRAVRSRSRCSRRSARRWREAIAALEEVVA